MGNPTGRHRPKRRHPGEGTVVKRHDRWRAKPWAAVVPYTDPSGRRRQTWLSAVSRAEAEAILRDELAKRRKAPVPTAHTVGTYVSGWLMTTDLSPRTFDRYRQHVLGRIIPSLGDVPLAELRAPMVREALGTWSGSDATKMGTFIVLRAAMRQAVADGMLGTDPTASVKAPRQRPTTPDVLDAPEARHLMATVKGERLAPLLTVALGLGLRRGEALGLRTPDIDLAAGTLTVRRSLIRVPVPARGPDDAWWRLVSPKADSGRTIPLPAFVAEALTLRIEARDAEQRAASVWAANDLVFCTRNGGPVPFSTLDNWWKGALKRAKLPDIRWHELRASCATVLLAEGVPEITVAAILGHRSLDMTRRYVRLLPRVSKDAAERLGRALGGVG
jgi:integrase